MTIRSCLLCFAALPGIKTDQRLTSSAFANSSSSSLLRSLNPSTVSAYSRPCRIIVVLSWFDMESDQEPAQPPLHQRIASQQVDAQKGSPLFSRLPPEIRSRIFAFAVAEYEDVNNPYPIDDMWKPTRSAPRRICLQLLLACRAVYLEACFLPFQTIEHSVRITGGHVFSILTAFEFPLVWARTVQKLNKLLARLKQLGRAKVDIGSLRVYATVEAVEVGLLLKVLQTPELHPRRLILNIGHDEWPDWEWGVPLCFEAGWVKRISNVISSSTQVFDIELEAVEQQKNQINVIGKHIAKHWFFRRSDGNVLYADASGKCLQVSHWVGPSSWTNRRWVVDVNGVQKIRYYTLTVSFELEYSVKAKGGMVSEATKKNAANPLYEHSPVRVGDILHPSFWDQTPTVFFEEEFNLTGPQVLVPVEKVYEVPSL
ncbi:hypothetical protein V8C44DRAFT_324860 [Trichoderma aethiopicum]